MSKKKKKIIIITIVVIIAILITVGVIFLINRKDKEKPVVKEIEVLDKIDGYDYILEDRDTEIYKEKFAELKKLLESDDIDDLQYASLLAELFTIDLYTIDNKISKYDVGGLDFLYSEELDKFKNKVMDTMYKLVEDNSSNTRKQNLPNVVGTEITNTEETTYKKGETNLSGYNIYVTIDYEKDLGYDKNVKVTVVKEQEKMYIVAITPINE